MRIYCAVCHKQFENDDIVTLDFVNTLTHKDCNAGSISNLKDIDTYEKLTNKYKFFHANRR